GRDSSQSDQLSPPKARPGSGEFHRHRSVVFLSVESPVLANGVAKQQVEHRPRWIAQFAVTLHHGARQCLLLSLNRLLGLVEKRILVFRLDSLPRIGARIRLPGEEITAAVRAIPSDLVGAQDQARECIPRIADAGNVPPSVGRVAGMNANAVAVDAADRFAGRSLI